MGIIDSPCLDCNKREVGCHGKCQEYIDFKAKRLEESKKYRDYMSDGAEADKIRRENEIKMKKKNKVK